MFKYLNLLDGKKYAGQNIMDYPSSFFTQKIYCYSSFKAQCEMNHLFAEKSKLLFLHT